MYNIEIEKEHKIRTSRTMGTEIPARGRTASYIGPKKLSKKLNKIDEISLDEKESLVFYGGKQILSLENAKNFEKKNIWGYELILNSEKNNDLLISIENYSDITPGTQYSKSESVEGIKISYSTNVTNKKDANIMFDLINKIEKVMTEIYDKNYLSPEEIDKIIPKKLREALHKELDLIK